ncbi:hypothetical protein TEU_08165 [Thermococcus eurythermalis]|uniref:Uncharacterized protein n=1 Tax=Thermococcus eurythermalis TaxID=1505907 RepID=A0A097QV02_9EURY|nr:hypothetical protein [Thermococcus eurythermalis]AIU70305.1 hypothetical protein TEU_08165 [Thermococcus eurythermalis]
MGEELHHLTLKSSVFIDDFPLDEEEEKALLTVEAYRISAESSLKKKKLATLAGITTAGVGLIALLQTANPMLGVGLVGAGIGTAVLAQLTIRPHPIKLFSKVHIPTLLVPYKGDSLAIVPPYFSEKNVPGVITQALTFYDANIQTAFEISRQLPTTHESLDAEIDFQNKLNEIKNSLTPKSALNFNVVAVSSNVMEPLLVAFGPVFVNDRPSRSLPFETEQIKEGISVVKTLENLDTRAETEIGILDDIERSVNRSTSLFVSGLQAMLEGIEKYFSEIRKLLKKNLLGGVNINAKPTKEELEKYGYAYVNHKYHIRLHSKYPTTSLIAIFQRHIDATEEKLRSKISEYVLEMNREIRTAREETQRRIERTERDYKRKIMRKEDQIKKLNHEIEKQKQMLISINNQIQALSAQIKNYQSEAEEYESRAQWAETASERRSYLSRANQIRKQADRLHNNVLKLYERGMKIKAEYEANIERLEELKMEKEELENEMETEIRRLKLEGDQKVREIQEYYTKQIQRVREDLDRFINIRDEHLSIIDAFYETVIESELNYQKAPIENRLKALQDAYSSVLDAINALRNRHTAFLNTIRGLALNLQVNKPTVVYIPVWAIVSEKGEEKLIPPSIVNRGKRNELLSPHPALDPAFKDIVTALRLDILIEAEGDNPTKAIREGLKNLDKLVERGLLTEKDVAKIRKVLGG